MYNIIRIPIFDENFSLEKLELASMICDNSVAEKLNHTPILSNIDIKKFLGDTMLVDVLFFMGNVRKEAFYSNTLTEEGVCRTINPINAKEIFRNDSVDLKFLTQYQFGSYGDMDPKFWSMEEGYTRNKIDNYPLRVYDGGKINGFNLYVKIPKSTLENIDTACQPNPLGVKIALHHPAEVLSSKHFFTVSYNKSVTFTVKPQITKTSDDLKKYDPSV
jgi:hypothetical protein